MIIQNLNTVYPTTYMKKDNLILDISTRMSLKEVYEKILADEDISESVIINAYRRTGEETLFIPHRPPFDEAEPGIQKVTVPEFEGYLYGKQGYADYFTPVPVLLLDCSGFTPAGFQGGETSVIPEMIRDAGSGGEAVVFLDEFDKILTPLPTSSGNDMNMVLQHELLTMTEGNVFPVRRNGRSCPVNTGKTLFIAMGAFTEYREEKDKRRGQISLGFTSGKEAPAGDSGRLSMEDLRRAGGRTELLGRFDHLYNFRPAGEKAFGDLFRHFIEELAIEQEIFIRATGAAVREFFSLAESEYGCREVKRTLYDTVKPCLIRMADETERINSCIVVRGIGKAVLEVRKPVSGHRQ